MFCAYSPRMLIYWQSSSILFQVGAVVAYFLKESGSGYGLLFEPSLAQFLVFYSHPRHFVCSVILVVSYETMLQFVLCRLFNSTSSLVVCIDLNYHVLGSMLY